MKRKNIQFHIDGLMVLILFGVFAVCMLTVLLTGANSYFRLTTRDQASYDKRTCIQYLTARVRRADSTGTVKIENFNSTDALVFSDSEGYVTRIYCHNGYLMELYSSNERELKAEDGEKIIEAANMSLSMEGSLLTVTVTDTNGEKSTTLLSLRSGEGAQI